ncbi:MAG: hypothetical protein ACLGHT_09775 [Acidimicrobiia bacterium]
MRPFNDYVGRGEYLSDHACPACDQLRCACTLGEQVEAALAPLGEEGDDHR